MTERFYLVMIDTESDPENVRVQIKEALRGGVGGSTARVVLVHPGRAEEDR